MTTAQRSYWTRRALAPTVLLLASVSAGCGREPSRDPFSDTEPPAASDTGARSSAARGDLEWTTIRDPYAEGWRWSYPSWAYEAVRGGEIERTYDLSAEVNPFLLNGDFDGDGQLDVAVWVVRREEDHPGADFALVVVHASGRVSLVDSVSGVWSSWEVYPRGAVEQGVGVEAPPDLRGDALLLVKPEAASTLLYWDGAAFLYYHQGD